MADLNDLQAAQTIKVTGSDSAGAEQGFISATTINSKIRLDTNSPTSGQTGAAVPFHAEYVGAQDGSGNIQALRIDASNNLQVEARAHDGTGTELTSTSLPGSATTKQSLDVNIVPACANYYSVPVQIRQSAATAANATVFAMRNAAASTRTVFIERIALAGTFDAASPVGRSLLRYALCRFSTATPTAGTAVTVIEMDNGNAATQVTDVRFLDTGLTTTGVVFESPFAIIGIPSSDGATVQYEREGIAIELAPGEGFCIRLITVAAIIGQGLSGEIVWSER